ncbi:MAG: xanthine dehydrogenase family protein subunit M [Hyphomicrobiaceae bacterium]|nr:MAG: xanthine dehydrogenase family protein subunit M [Hyphomicrobiaceae bacterium]
MKELQYHRPVTVEDAVGILQQGDGRALSGGTDLIAQMREGRRSVRHVVDLKHIPELTSLTRSSDGGWRVGAAMPIGTLGRNEAFATDQGPLLASARLIGSLQIQNRASLGGNICNAAPSADAAPLLICLGAEAEIAGTSGRRVMQVGQVATGPGRTSLGPAEILVAIRLPPLEQKRSRGAYLRFTPRREMDIAIAGAAAFITLDDRHRIRQARITLASVAPVPLVAERAARMLIGEQPSAALFKEAGAAAAAEARPISDLRGSAGYRRTLVEVLTKRALGECARALGVGIR